MADPNQTRFLLITTSDSSEAKVRAADVKLAFDSARDVAPHRNRILIDTASAFTSGDLQYELLRTEPTVVGVCGEGARSDASSTNRGLKLSRAPAKHLGKLFELFQNSIRCVIMDGDFADDQAHAVAGAIDLVIRMSGLLATPQACDFAHGFLLGVGYGQSVFRAVALGCNRIALAGGESLFPILVALRHDPRKYLLLDIVTEEPDLPKDTAVAESTAPTKEEIEDWLERANERFRIGDADGGVAILRERCDLPEQHDYFVVDRGRFPVIPPGAGGVIADICLLLPWLSTPARTDQRPRMPKSQLINLVQTAATLHARYEHCVHFIVVELLANLLTKYQTARAEVTQRFGDNEQRRWVFSDLRIAKHFSESYGLDRYKWPQIDASSRQLVAHELLGCWLEALELDTNPFQEPEEWQLPQFVRVTGSTPQVLPIQILTAHALGAAALPKDRMLAYAQSVTVLRQPRTAPPIFVVDGALDLTTGHLGPVEALLDMFCRFAAATWLEFLVENAASLIPLGQRERSGLAEFLLWVYETPREIILDLRTRMSHPQESSQVLEVVERLLRTAQKPTAPTNRHKYLTWLGLRPYGIAQTRLLLNAPSADIATVNAISDALTAIHSELSIRNIHLTLFAPQAYATVKWPFAVIPLRWSEAALKDEVNTRFERAKADTLNPKSFDHLFDLVGQDTPDLVVERLAAHAHGSLTRLLNICDELMHLGAQRFDEKRAANHNQKDGLLYLSDIDAIEARLAKP